MEIILLKWNNPKKSTIFSKSIIKLSYVLYSDLNVSLKGIFVLSRQLHVRGADEAVLFVKELLMRLAPEKRNYSTSNYVSSKSISILINIHRGISHKDLPIFNKSMDFFHPILNFKIQIFSNIILQRNLIVSLKIVVEQGLRRAKLVWSSYGNKCRRKCICNRRYNAALK